MSKKLLIVLSVVSLFVLGLAGSSYATAVTSAAITSGGNIVVNGNTIRINLSTDVTSEYSLDDDLISAAAKVVSAHAAGTRMYGLDSDGGSMVAATKSSTAAVNITVPAAAANWASSYTAAFAKTN